MRELRDGIEAGAGHESSDAVTRTERASNSLSGALVRGGRRRHERAAMCLVGRACDGLEADIGDVRVLAASGLPSPRGSGSWTSESSRGLAAAELGQEDRPRGRRKECSTASGPRPRSESSPGCTGRTAVREHLSPVQVTVSSEPRLAIKTV